MDFAFSEEQEALRASARDYLADRFPLDRVVQLADSDAGWDPETWRELADMGWLDPELGALEHAVLAEETGFGLLPAPLFSTLALAGPLLDDELRSGVAAGERSATLASAGDVTASGDRLSGTRRLVPDLTSVTDVVVPTADGVFAVDLTAHPDVVVARSTMDRTRRLGELRLDNTPARRLDASLDTLTHVRRRSLAWASCEAVGVAQRALDLAADYTKTRQQFGRVIGTYQGVSHRVSNIFVSVQLGRSLAYWASWAVSEADAQQDIAVAAAKSAATEGAVFSCENAIQAHGGIGFTWEHVLHRFYKRAQWLEAFEGFGRVHRARIAAAVLDGADGEVAA
ncbi:MAG TPA: acyl-CoA dehydrogenase family protein [Mycobacteriales bacterium]|jgi:alkylation response protein AidB-like acyl-CoA dehydrogenase|nr:acyl-CoA dehydrogenase family protein [Mycobacteriales bacterium]